MSTIKSQGEFQDLVGDLITFLEDQFDEGITWTNESNARGSREVKQKAILTVDNSNVVITVELK